MGSNEIGMPVPEFKTSAGSFHMSGCLEITPEAFLWKWFSNLLELATIICFLPLPRYVKKPRCNDELNMINWAESDFSDILLSGSVACSGELKAEGKKMASPLPSSTLSAASGNLMTLLRLRAVQVYPYGGKTMWYIWRWLPTTTLQQTCLTRLRTTADSCCLARQGEGWPASFQPQPKQLTLSESECISGELRAARGSMGGGQCGGYCGGQSEGQGRDPWRGPRHFPY